MYLLKHLEKENQYFTSIRYKDLKNMKVGEAIIEQALNIWGSIGFLDDIEDEEKKKELAIAFNNITHDLLYGDDKVSTIKHRYNYNCGFPSFDFEVIVYPLLRRLIVGNKVRAGIDNFDYDKFIEYLEKYSFLSVNYDVIDEKFKGEYDIEAEMTCILAGIIEDIFNKK